MESRDSTTNTLLQTRKTLTGPGGLFAVLAGNFVAHALSSRVRRGVCSRCLEPLPLCLPKPPSCIQGVRLIPVHRVGCVCDGLGSVLVTEERRGWFGTRNSRQVEFPTRAHSITLLLNAFLADEQPV
jgi:hypothetical protein